MEVWEPQEGDRLDGKVLRVEQKESRRYGPYRFIPVTTDDGRTIAVMDLRAVLRKGLKDVKAGDGLSIVYCGRRQSARAGRVYEDYDVEVFPA